MVEIVYLDQKGLSLIFINDNMNEPKIVNIEKNTKIYTENTL